MLEFSCFRIRTKFLGAREVPSKLGEGSKACNKTKFVEITILVLRTFLRGMTLSVMMHDVLLLGIWISFVMYV